MMFLTPGIATLVLAGLNGNDVFNVTGAQPYTGGISLQGGPAANGDVANVTGNGAAVTNNLGDTQTLTSTVMGGGFAGAVSLIGVPTDIGAGHRDRDGRAGVGRHPRESDEGG